MSERLYTYGTDFWRHAELDELWVRVMRYSTEPDTTEQLTDQGEWVLTAPFGDFERPTIRIQMRDLIESAADRVAG